MTWISVYRRYEQPQWVYRQARQSRQAPRQSPRPAPPRREQPPPPGPPQSPRREPERKAPPSPPRPEPQGGLGGALRRVLPEGMDTGDLFLAAILLFLYAESKDDDFLIILIVVGLSIFKKDKGGDASIR